MIIKGLFLLTLWGWLTTNAEAQYNPHYSQFIFNKLAINPAYAGAKEHLSLMALYRYQWQGLRGAPRTMTVNAHAPIINKRIGLGLNIINDQIGMINTNYVNGMYAYRTHLKNDGILSTGLAIRFAHSRMDWSQALILDEGDAYVPMDRPSLTSFNFGFGLYYSKSNYYIGLSMPAILKKSLYNIDNSNQMIQDLRTYYLMAGTVFEINDLLYVKPSILFSYIPTAPYEMDVNLSIIFLRIFWTGLTYRLGDSVDAVFQCSITKQLKLGVAIDYTLSKLRHYTPGSLEVSLEYVFRKNNSHLAGIRFF